jgi:gliding motility-associated-like protein
VSKSNKENMKKINRLCKILSITLLFLISSVGMAYSQTPTLKNNPVKTNPSPFGETYLTGTTFSIANDESETDKTYFKLSEVIFGRPIATLEMGSKYQEYNGVWDHTVAGVNPCYAILSNPAVLACSARQDGVNRLICQMPAVGETIFKVKVSSYKPGSAFSISMMMEEVSGAGDAQLILTVNGRSINYSEMSVSSGGSAHWQPYESSFDTSELDIEVKFTGGSGAVLAFSDLYIYGGLDVLSISASESVVTLGTPVTFTATSASDVDLDAVAWEKNANGAGYAPLLDDSGAQLVGATMVDKPETGETCYRAIATVEGAIVYSNEVCVSAEYKCATNSAQHNLFIEDFGTLASETARSSGSVDYINTSIYSFIDNCKPLKAEGTYALMTNPKFAGYGDLGNDDNSCSPDVNNLWFRDLYDHTFGGQKDGQWGAMLMVNAANLAGTTEQLVYSRTVEMPCTNTNMIFSAWFANAANPQRVSTQISMKFVVRDQNGNVIEAATLQIDEIKPEDGWVKGETSFNSGNNEKLTVEIYNCIEGGNGNDFMVDDISFSICTPEVSLIPEPTSNDVVINGEFVTGPCREAITLNVQTSMIEAIFDTPQYLWFMKDVSSSNFVHLSNNDNQTFLRTAIAPYTQYFVVATANAEDARNYLAGQLSVCSPVAVSNTVTLLCTPNLEVTVTARKCDKVYLTGTVYDAPDSFNFWWEQSTDGEHWTKMPYPNSQQSIEYTLTESTYFRINSEFIPSKPTELQEMTGVSLESSVELGYPGTLVTFTATTLNLPMEGSMYRWYNSTSEGEWSEIKSTLEPELEYTIQNTVETIKVVAGACDATVTIKKLDFYMQPVTQECNDVILKPISLIGEDETVSYKWQYLPASASEWKDLPNSLIQDVEVEDENGEKIEGCVKIRITEDTQFRLVGVGEYGELISNPDQGVTSYKFNDNCIDVPWTDDDIVYPAFIDSTRRECNTITLYAGVQEGIAFNWQKSIDGEVWEDMSETTSPLTVLITEPTMFRVKTSQEVVSDSTGFIELMLIELTIDKQSIILGDEVTVTATSTNIDSSEPITWFENDVQQDVQGDSYVSKPLVATKYSAMQAGCVAEAVAVTEIIWPTVFTPMVVDGFNDDFVVNMEPNVALKIYDRYGNLVIETTNGWDGKDANGNYAMPNVYFYVATLANGEVVKGNVELLNEKQK